MIRSISSIINSKEYFQSVVISLLLECELFELLQLGFFLSGYLK